MIFLMITGFLWRLSIPRACIGLLRMLPGLRLTYMRGRGTATGSRISLFPYSLFPY